jgi:D-3-phosphoglycerate dehydrogenase
MTWARAESLARARADGLDIAANRAAFYAGCDVISPHMRLVPATRGTVTAADLALMKPSAMLATPRLGYVTEEEYKLRFRDIFNQILAFGAGAPANVVNPDVLGHRR